MMKLKKAPIRSIQSRSLLAGAISLCSLVGWSQSAIAEGTRELVQNGGNRPYTEWRTNSTAGLLRRTVLKVYANAGEVINLGSSAVGVNLGDIVLFNGTDNVSTATPQLRCSTAQPSTGILNSRAKEIAGPLPASSGYTPCTYTAPTSGVYQVAFYGPNGPTGSADPGTTPNDGPTSINTPVIDGQQASTVSMWDITVRSSAASTTDLNGRVFADYIALIMDANSRYLKSNVYILTDDGYQYSTNLGIGRGIDPNGFLFFANEKGLLASSGQPLYHTGRKAGDNTMTPPLDGGVTIQPPSYPLFFNLPSNTAIAGLGIPLTAQPPAPASNFQFTGGTGGSGNQTPQSVGGTFSFSAPQSGNYQIIIDTNNDGVYNPVSGDRAMDGSVNAGFNTVAWDGKNGNGSVLPPRSGNAPYSARIILKGGEYHFPLIDAESGADGFRIQMLNPPGAFSNGANATTIYFDERDYTLGATNVTLGCIAAGLPVCDGRSGVDSLLGAHKYGTHTGNSNDYGDTKALDTWIYYPSGIVLAPLVITTTNRANVQAKKSVKFLTDTDGNGKVTVGDRVEYTITYSNPTPAATSDAINFIISETLPSQLIFVSATIASQTPGNTIALTPGYAGSGALTSVNTLRKGDTIIIKVVATINATNSGNPISNQASASFTTPDSPATTGTAITDADSAGATANPPSLNNPFLQTADDGANLGNDPTSTADDDPTLIMGITFPPNLRLVKRVTAIATIPITGFNDVTTGTNAADDNASGWITSPPYLQGAFDVAQIPAANQPKPSDGVEYTIYFLSDGGANAQTVALCDFVPSNSTYVPNSLKLSIGAGAPIAISDATGGADTDGGFYPTLSTFPNACSTGINKGNGAVVVNIGTVDRSTGSGAPATSYGFIRFRATVN